MQLSVVWAFWDGKSNYPDIWEGNFKKIAETCGNCRKLLHMQKKFWESIICNYHNNVVIIKHTKSQNFFVRKMHVMDILSSAEKTLPFIDCNSIRSCF